MVYISGGKELINPETLLSKVGIKQGMKIADLGCGTTGRFCIPAAKLTGNTGVVYIIDILKSVLNEVSRKARLEGVNNIKAIWANLEIFGSTKIKNDFIDVATLINILFQSKEHKNILKEAYRILKINGKLLVVDWKQTAIPFGPPLIDRVKPEAIKKIARELNFQLIEEFSAGQYHYGLIFSKI